MKMFYFRSKGWYGPTYTVMAENEIEAYKAIVSYLNNEMLKEGEWDFRSDGSRFRTCAYEDYHEWADHGLPTDYVIEEFNVGDVLESEIS